MKARPSTILLSGEIDRGYEGIAVAAIRPGMLITIRGALPTDLPTTVPGRNKNVGPHNVAGGVGTSFAREMDLIGSDIDDIYENGENVLYFTARPGDRVYALLAAGQDITVAGTRLESAGNGYLRVAAAGTPGTTFPGNAIAVALEAVDNDPGTGGAPVRIKVEVL